MDKSVIRKSALALALLLLPSLTLAAGLGKLTVFSALGQPLKAEIELLAVQKDEADSLSVRLPSPDVFRKANIDYSGALLSLQFKLERRDDHYVIALSSTQPINEPFLDLLVELDWNTGRLVREYTFLLDPPEYKPPQAAPAIAAPVTGTPAIKSVEMPKQPLPERAFGAETKAPAVSTAVAPAPAPAAPKPARPKPARPKAAAPQAPLPRAAAPAPAQPKAAAPKSVKTYQVKRGDTLTKIANATKSDHVSLQQMLIALYRSNVDEFDGNNINRIRAGKILKIPDAETAAAIDQEEATRTILAQGAEFNEYRRKLGAAVAAAPERAQQRGQRASGKITARVEEKPAPAKAAEDQLRLSRAEEGTKRSVQGLQEDLYAKEKEIKDANERIAMLEKNLQDMQKLLQLKSGAGAQLQQQAAKEGAAGKAPAAAKPAAPSPQAPAEAAKAQEAPKAAPTPAPKPPAAKTPRKLAPPPPPPPPPPSLLDEILGNELALYGGGGLLLILFAGYFYYAWRRKKAQQQLESSLIAAPELPAEAVFGAGAKAEPEPSEIQAAFAPAAAAEAEAVDPIAEAEVYMAYGRDMQAEDILKEALAKEPSRQAIRAKLLEIYAGRKDTKAFEAVAAELQAATGGAGAEWERALALGAQLDPANPLYGGKPAAVEAPAAAAALAGMPEPEAPEQATGMTGLDFDLGLGEPAPSAAAETEAAPAAAELEVSAGLDFDLGLGEPEQPAAAEPEAAEKAAAEPELPAGLDFDLGLGEPEKAEAPVAEPAAAAPSAASGDLGFDLDLGGGEEQKAEPPQAEQAPPAPAEAAAAIDFDFALPESGEASVQQAAELAPEAPAPEVPALEIPAVAEPERVEPTTAPEIPASAEAAALELPATEAKAPAAGEELQLPAAESLELPALELPEAATPEGVAAAEAPELPPLEPAATQAPELPLAEAAPTAEAAEASAAETPGAAAAAGGLDFDFNLELPEQKEDASSAAVDLSSISLDLGAPGEAALSPDAQWQEVATKLDLAKAYQEMGDMDGARELLDEVLKEGDAAQKQQAQSMLTALG